LRAPVEEIRERKGAIRSLKLVGLFHALPGHRHSAARQRIKLAREFFLGGEQSKAGLQPFLVRDHFVIGHERLRLMSAGPSLDSAAFLETATHSSAAASWAFRSQLQLISVL